MTKTSTICPMRLSACEIALVKKTEAWRYTALSCQEHLRAERLRAELHQQTVAPREDTAMSTAVPWALAIAALVIAIIR